MIKYQTSNCNKSDVQVSTNYSIRSVDKVFFVDVVKEIGSRLTSDPYFIQLAQVV